MDTNELKDVEEVVESIRGKAEEAGHSMKEAFGAAKNWAESLFGSLKKVASVIGGGVLTGLKAIKNVALTALKGIGKIGSTFFKASTGVAKLASGYDSIKKISNAFQGLGKSIGRIAFYRIIRSMIKAITEAFKEGLENAYAFSSGIATEGHRFAEALDSMSTAGLTMKNQLGSAFISLLAAIQPIVNMIIGLVTRLADAISQLISALTGMTYLKAIEYPKKWGEAAKGAGKAAKEWKNQILGFDEINRLEAPSNGGGGGGASALDPMSMFQDTPISDEIKKFVDALKMAIMNGKWVAAGKMLAQKINSIFPPVWQWNIWGQKLGYYMDGAAKVLLTTLEKIDFKGIGSKLAWFINGILTKIDFTVWGKILVRKMTAAIEFFAGFLGKLDWKLVGDSIGHCITGAFSAASEWLSSQDWAKVGETVAKKLRDLFEGLDFSSIARAFFELLGVALMAASELLGSFFAEVFSGVYDYFSDQVEEVGGNIWKGILTGMWEGVKNGFTWLKENVWDPFIEGCKEVLGIHSPSTVFKDIGTNIVDGLWEGISEKWVEFKRSFENLWSELKRWWEGLKLGAFHIPRPVFSWTYTEATGAIARALEFVGLPSTIPHLNISWAAKGGIVDGATLIGAGEAGMEAIVPLERNTEWMRIFAHEMNSVNESSDADTAAAVEEGSDNIVSAIMGATMQIISAMNGRQDNGNMDLDGIVREITRIQRRQARSTGAA